jgi:hypothetical protein
VRTGAVTMLLAVLCGGCALDSRPRLVAPLVCPDGAPVRWLQDPSCGRVCGFSCLPERWQDPSITLKDLAR